MSGKKMPVLRPGAGSALKSSRRHYGDKPAVERRMTSHTNMHPSGMPARAGCSNEGGAFAGIPSGCRAFFSTNSGGIACAQPPAQGFDACGIGTAGWLKASMSAASGPPDGSRLRCLRHRDRRMAQGFDVCGIGTETLPDSGYSWAGSSKKSASPPFRGPLAGDIYLTKSDRTADWITGAAGGRFDRRV
jgi:hypothetical protein